MTDTQPRDSRIELGEFLKTRRARLTPADVRLPVYTGGRRVPGLRREEVALLGRHECGLLHPDRTGQLHRHLRGRPRGLTHALRLDQAEQAHLHALAGTPTRRPRHAGNPPGSGSVPPSNASWTRCRSPQRSSSVPDATFSPPTPSDEP